MSLKILLADDSMTAQNMGKKILSDAGHEVVAVSNGAAAMKKINADKFDLLILDVFMPGYSGLEVCEKVRGLPDRAASLVLLTVGKMEPFNAEEGNKVKADGVIVKPFEASDLLAAVQKIAAKAPAKPKVDLDKTVRLTQPIVPESDQSYQEWSVTNPQEEPKAQNVEVPAEQAATAALDSVFDEEPAAAPAPDVTQTAKLTPWTSEPAPVLDEVAPAAPPVSDWSNAADWAHPGAAVEAPPLETHAEESPLEVPAEPTPLEMHAEAPASEPPAFDLSIPSAHEESPLAVEAPAGAHFELESMLEPAAHAAHEEPVQVEPAPEIEFTAARHAAEVSTEHPLGFESHETEDHHAHAGPDPNLVTDRSQLVTEFATHFTAPEPEASAEAVPAVEETPAEPAAEVPAAEPEFHVADSPEASAALAHEMEQSLTSAPPAAPVEAPAPPPPATLEQSLEHAMAAPEPEPAPEAPAAAPKAADLEFAAALAQAISNAPVAAPEPLAPAASAASPAAAAESAAAAAPLSATSILSRLDPDAITRAVHRVVDRMKAEIIQEILRENNK